MNYTVTAIISIIILSCPYKFAATSLILGVFCLTQAQFLSVAGIDFTPQRFLLVVSLIRCVSKREYEYIQINKTDKYMIAYQVIAFCIFLARHSILPSRLDSIPYAVGALVESNIVYFLFRCWFKDSETYKGFTRNLAIIIIPLAVLMSYEVKTGRNMYSYLGGVRMISYYRDGAYRAQGCFRGPITAGSVGAAIIPLFIGLLPNKVHRNYGIIGVFASIAIVLNAHSSGAVLGLAGGLLAVALWFIKSKMAYIRWSIFGALFGFHVFMKAPVWFLIAKVSDLVGGGGWHRSNLIDKFVHSFGQWWLIGMPIEDTANWAATTLNSGVVDITNQFVAVGIGGGLISLVLFTAVISQSFKNVGMVVGVTKDVKSQFVNWCLGCSLMTHVLILISVTYWDQSFFIWYLTLALITSLSSARIVSDEISDVELDCGK